MPAACRPASLPVYRARLSETSSLAHVPSEKVLPRRPLVPVGWTSPQPASAPTDVMFPASPSSPTEENKPKPSCAPHLRDAYEFSEPADSDAMEEFHCPINFDFCRQPVQPRASIGPCPEFASQPKSRACAKLMVRSGLRCCLCFKLKAACVCLKAFQRLGLSTQGPPFATQVGVVAYGPGLPI